jgi:hypothetical protein
MTTLETRSGGQFHLASLEPLALQLPFGIEFMSVAGVPRIDSSQHS